MVWNEIHSNDISFNADDINNVFGQKGEKLSDAKTSIQNTFLQRMSGITRVGFEISVPGTTNTLYDLDESFISR